MATIVAAAGAAGNWTAGTAWVGGVAPTAADDAQVTVTTTSLTIDPGAVCRSADFTGFTGSLTAGASSTLTIGDATAGASNKALTMPSGFTFSPNSASTITFISTSSTQQTVSIDSGYTMGNIIFNSASNGNYAIIANLTLSTTSTLTLTKGTLHVDGTSDNAGLTHSWGKYISDNGNTRTINFGNSSITIKGTGAAFSTNNVTGLTISSNTATITMTGSGATFQSANINWQGISIIQTGSGTMGTSGAAGTPTVLNFTRTGTASVSDEISLVSNLTCTGTFTCNGNSNTNRVLIKSSSAGTRRTITAATVSVSNSNFKDIAAAGAGSWNFSAITSIGDNGNNTGITFYLSKNPANSYLLGVW